MFSVLLIVACTVAFIAREAVKEHMSHTYICMSLMLFISYICIEHI